MKNAISLRTPFIVKVFDSIDLFIKTVFPDIEKYLQKELSLNISYHDLEAKTYQELEKQFKLFIVQNYKEEINEYIKKEAKHANKEAMKKILLSTVSITLNVRDATNHKLTEDDYLISLRNLIKKIDR